MLGITFTGIDEQTDLQRIRQLQAQGAEVGILVSETPEGRHRYPPIDWIAGAVRILAPRVALHVCGRQARAALLVGCYDRLLGRVQRLQVNGPLDRWQVTDLLVRCRLNGMSQLITQHTLANGELAVFPDARDHALLVDGSGGRGVLPEAWVAPETTKAVGFAGGLGPATIPAAMPQILAVAKPGAWVDMEGRLRSSDDWFDVALAEEAMAAFQKAIAP